MNVLLTGGTGFVGINIAEVLAESGMNVTVYSRRPMLKEAMDMLGHFKGKVEWCQGDVLNKDTILSVLKQNKIDVVVHAAAITPDSIREKAQMSLIMNVNCIGTLKVLEAAHEYGVKRFIYISSVAMYGDSAQKFDPLHETDIPNPNNTYEISKFASERLIRRYRELNNSDIVALRLGDVFGAWEYQSGVRDTMSALYQTVKAAMCKQKVILAKRASTGWIYVKDTALAVKALIETPVLNHFEYNCGSIFKWSVFDWCKMLKAEFDGFDFEIGTTETANIRFHSIKDNAMMDMSRLLEDTGFAPQYDMAKSFADYICWAKRYPDLAVTEPER
jgi:nucleoside-diphosphate-sugar epimerase